MSERDQIREQNAEELKNKLSGEGAEEETASDRSEPVHVESAEHLQDLVDEGGVVLTDFYADWCGPCKMLEPIVNEIAAETDATVAKVDVDAQQRLAQQYRVQGVPTMYLFADGEQVEQMVGVRQKDQLVSLVQQYA
ncbi:thioredoxin [Halobaculum gomorrense]|uniref:Thioredoxin n=1 Tax=Halobaculum gomorrense TaxID=43928 RepID=A0A1M5NSM8_9EURY|nr:thioredoxin [Halobaculum gomorrense]SHG92468.1 thioredoxin [Halobaculum gomorrense]